MPANETRETAKILKLAAMDWALAPTEVIRQDLNLPQSSIVRYRQNKLYLETVEELKESFHQKMLATPGTNELRKTINYGLSIAVKKLVAILAGSRTPNRDIIGAARLMAQMDGRFLGHDAEEARAQGGIDTESVAQELITAIRRQKESVQ